MIFKKYEQQIFSFGKNRAHLEAEVKEYKIVRRNKTRIWM